MTMKRNKSFGYMLKKSLAEDINLKDQIKIKYRPYQYELVQKYEEGERFFYFILHLIA